MAPPCGEGAGIWAMAAPGARPHPNTCPGHSRSYGASHVSRRHPAAGMLPRGEIRRGLTACRRGAVPATLQFCAAQKTNILSNRGCYCDVLVLRKKKKNQAALGNVELFPGCQQHSRSHGMGMKAGEGMLPCVALSMERQLSTGHHFWSSRIRG